MNKFKRLLIQLFLWLLVWITLSIGEQGNTSLIVTNSIAFILQGLLIFGLIYFAAPQLLFKKKYLYFTIISIIAIIAFAYITPLVSSLYNAQSLPHPPHLRPRHLPEGSGLIDPLKRRFPPAPTFLVPILMLTISHILASLIETFLFIKKKEEEAIVTKSENIQNELKLLKSQINPHFLFNSLNNIYALSAIDTTKTQQSISYLSDMLRYVLYECESSFVPIKNEVKYIENYIKLFSLKSSKKYPIETSFNILHPNIEIAPMLLIPFVENAFKHSNIEKIKDTFIKLSINANAKTITFKIENTIASAQIIKDTVGGIGLENVKKRLAILYPERHSLKINENNGLFVVELNLKTNV